MEDKNNILARQEHGYSNEQVSLREQIESDADKISKSTIVSSCEQTRSNALSSTSTTNNITEKNKGDENNLDEGTPSVGSKGSDKVANDIKTDLDNL